MHTNVVFKHKTIGLYVSVLLNLLTLKADFIQSNFVGSYTCCLINNRLKLKSFKKKSINTLLNKKSICLQCDKVMMVIIKYVLKYKFT